MDHGVELLTFLKKPRPREVEFCAQVSQSVHKISDDVGPAVWRIVAAPSECPQTCPMTQYAAAFQLVPTATPVILTGG